jgi:hypothetical protein
VMPGTLEDRLLQNIGMNLCVFTYQQTEVKGFVLSEHNVTTEHMNR